MSVSPNFIDMIYVYMGKVLELSIQKRDFAESLYDVFCTEVAFCQLPTTQGQWVSAYGKRKDL